MASSKSLERVRRYAAAKSRQDIREALAQCTDDFVLDTVAFGIRGRGTVQVAAQLHDYHVDIEGEAATRDACSAWGTVHGTMRGPLGSFAPTGRAFALPFACVFALRAARLASERFFFGPNLMCEQLGLPVAGVSDELRAFRTAQDGAREVAA